MTMPAIASLAALPHATPKCPNAHLALFAIRRIGAHGLSDARAAHALLTAFRENFRRPLMLLRALMAELAAASAGTISIAPCCCAGMTHAEAALVTILSRVETNPGSARLLLADLLGVRHVEGVLASAAAVAMAFADEGRPIAA